MSRYNRSTSSGYGLPDLEPRGPDADHHMRRRVCCCRISTKFHGGRTLTRSFGLVPILVIHNFYLWQLVTYIFLHGRNTSYSFQHAGPVDVWFGSGTVMGRAKIHDIISLSVESAPDC